MDDPPPELGWQRLVLREYPATLLAIEPPGLYQAKLLRPATGVPERLDHVAERRALDLAQQFYILLGPEVRLPAPRLVCQG
jgi:hypothetical protein